MNYMGRLAELWERIPEQLPERIKERGYMVSVNQEKKDILITGINPSFRERQDCTGHYAFDFRKDILENPKGDRYWTPLKRMLCSGEIDLRPQAAYLDLFCHRDKEQSSLRKEILSCDGGVAFIAEQLNIAQHVIEEIVVPKIIVVSNREAAAYWGKLAERGCIWMGYKLKHIEDLSCGGLYQVEGLLESEERIALEIKESNLKGSLILFSSYACYTPKEKRPTAEKLQELLTQCPM